MNQQISVQVTDLVKRFGNFVAVDHLSFAVRQGEIFGFLGSNGAGKSTTIRMLCGLLHPSAGSASVGGFDVYTQPEEIKRNIGYMSQKFSLYDELTVEENIDFFSGIYGLRGEHRKRRREAVLEMADLREQRRVTTRLLPGGWKQRLALGCAILHEPPILFLDEPTSGVDPMARRSFWELIQHLSRKGHTIFVTTHYMDEAEYCHRLALMHAGVMIALDSPRRLREAAAASTRRLALESAEVLESLSILRRVRGVKEVSIFGGGLHAVVQDSQAARSQIEEAHRARGIDLYRLQAIEPSVEDVFVSMIEAEERRRS